MNSLDWPTAAVCMTLAISIAWMAVTAFTQRGATQRRQLHIESVERLSRQGQIPAAEASAAISGIGSKRGPKDGQPGGRQF